MWLTLAIHSTSAEPARFVEQAHSRICLLFFSWCIIKSLRLTYMLLFTKSFPSVQRAVSYATSTNIVSEVFLGPYTKKSGRREKACSGHIGLRINAVLKGLRHYSILLKKASLYDSVRILSLQLGSRIFGL